MHIYVYISTFIFAEEYFNSNGKDLSEVINELLCFAESIMWPKRKYIFARERLLSFNQLK